MKTELHRAFIDAEIERLETLLKKTDDLKVYGFTLKTLDKEAVITDPIDHFLMDRQSILGSVCHGIEKTIKNLRLILNDK